MRQVHKKYLQFRMGKQKGQDWDHKAYLMHQVLYIVQLPNEEGDMHIIYHLVHHVIPMLSLLLFIQFLSKLQNFIYLYNCNLQTDVCNYDLARLTVRYSLQ